MHRLKPTGWKRAILLSGLAIAVLLPGGVTAAEHASRMTTSGPCTATLPELVPCQDSSDPVRSIQHQRRRARRQSRTDGGSGDVHSFREVGQHPGPTYGEWLSMQLRAKRMTQRQLAERTGIDHSTISRIIKGSRNPTLRTALGIQEALREELASLPVTTRVERVLRSDDLLNDDQVATIMRAYIAMRKGAQHHADGVPTAHLVRIVKRG